MLDGMKYLLYDTTDHLMIVPTVPASMTAQSIRPANLSKDSFSVMPSISKKRKKSKSSSSVNLAKHKRSNDSCSGSNDSSVVYVHVKKKNTKKTGRTTKKMKTTKPVDLVSSQYPLSAGDEDKTTVVDDCAVIVPTLSLEVKTQDLSESADFCKAKAQEEGDILEGNRNRRYKLHVCMMQIKEVNTLAAIVLELIIL
jgi:hypothetical protein